MFKQFFSLAVCVATVSAHMQLYDPPPFRAYNNPHTIGKPDAELLFPHNCCGKVTPMPCRGYLKLLGTPEGASVANWAAGSKQSWSMVGPAPLGGNHYGGSCQIGFSVDKGKTFNTAVSYEGNCPHRQSGEDPSGQKFPFTVPSDLPNGDVVFAWTWINREQEFFMNCAVVTITGGSGSAASPNNVLGVSSAPASSPMAAKSSGTAAKASAASVPSPVAANVAAASAVSIPSANPETPAAPSASAAASGRKCNSSRRKCRNSQRTQPLLDVASKYKRSVGEKSQRFVQRAATIAFTSRPAMLFANVNNGCSTPKTNAELKYPNPGPDVVEGDGEYPLRLPSGTCG